MQLTDSILESVLPNTLITVDGEETLSQRVAGYVPLAEQVVSAMTWGTFSLPEELEPIALRAIACHTLIRAIPALDLVVTPTGFGVVSTEQLGPASKERVERLISTLSATLDDLLCQLQKSLTAYPEWRAGSPGKWYCESFLPYLEDARLFNFDPPLLYVNYRQIRALSTTFEQALSERYLGKKLMDHLRESRFGNDGYPEIIRLIRSAEIRYISKYLKRSDPPYPNEEELWMAARPIISAVGMIPDLHEIWDSSMGARFKAQPFENKSQGGYFF